MGRDSPVYNVCPTLRLKHLTVLMLYSASTHLFGQLPSVNLTYSGSVCQGKDLLLECDLAGAMAKGFRIELVRGSQKTVWSVDESAVYIEKTDKDLNVNATLRWDYPKNNQTAAFVIHQPSSGVTGMEAECIPCKYKDGCGAFRDSNNKRITDTVTLEVLDEVKPFFLEGRVIGTEEYNKLDDGEETAFLLDDMVPDPDGHYVLYPYGVNFTALPLQLNVSVLVDGTLMDTVETNRTQMAFPLFSGEIQASLASDDCAMDAQVVEKSPVFGNKPVFDDDLVFAIDGLGRATFTFSINGILHNRNTSPIVTTPEKNIQVNSTVFNCDTIQCGYRFNVTVLEGAASRFDVVVDQHAVTYQTDDFFGLAGLEVSQCEARWTPARVASQNWQTKLVCGDAVFESKVDQPLFLIPTQNDQSNCTLTVTPYFDGQLWRHGEATLQNAASGCAGGDSYLSTEDVAIAMGIISAIVVGVPVLVASIASVVYCSVGGSLCSKSDSYNVNPSPKVKKKKGYKPNIGHNHDDGYDDGDTVPLRIRKASQQPFLPRVKWANQDCVHDYEDIDAAEKFDSAECSITTMLDRLESAISDPHDYEDPIPTGRFEPSDYEDPVPTGRLEPSDYEDPVPTGRFEPSDYEDPVPTARIRPTGHERPIPSQRIEGVDLGAGGSNRKSVHSDRVDYEAPVASLGSSPVDNVDEDSLGAAAKPIGSSAHLEEGYEQCSPNHIEEDASLIREPS